MGAAYRRLDQQGVGFAGRPIYGAFVSQGVSGRSLVPIRLERTDLLQIFPCIIKTAQRETFIKSRQRFYSGSRALPG